MNTIPDPIIFHILSYLPAKDLVRNQTVSKRWQNIILTDQFARQHVHNFKANSQEAELLVMQGDQMQCVVRSATTLKQTLPPLHTLGNPHTIDTWEYHQSLEGLILLSQNTGHPDYRPLLLWNPSIKKTLRVPYLNPPPHLDPNLVLYVNLGVGYSSTERSYRVVQLLFYKHMLYQIAYYTLTTHAWTTEPYKGFPLKWTPSLTGTAGTLYQERLFFLYWDEAHQIVQFLSCHLHTAALTAYPCPPGIYEALNEMRQFTLTVVEGESTLGMTDFETCLLTLEPPEIPVEQRTWQTKYYFRLPPACTKHMKFNNEIIIQQHHRQPPYSLPVDNTLIGHTEIARRHQLPTYTTFNIITPSTEYASFRNICKYTQSLALLNINCRHDTQQNRDF